MLDKLAGLTQVITKIFASRTLIVNWAVLAASTITLWMGSEVLQSYPELGLTLASALAFVNLILRALTGQPLSEK